MIDRLHPLSILIYFLSASLIPAFSRNPVLHTLCLITGFLMLFTWADAGKILKRVPVFLLFFLIISLFNPFFYHNGNTVLFYVAGRRFSLEALLFGADSALIVIGVSVWFISLSHYMTGDKVLLLFGVLSTKLATIVSLIMRIIPHYASYINAYRKQQKLMGIYGEGTFLERLRAEAKIFAGFLTWSLEHSMTTADSMTSRGYGVAKRKSYRIYRIRQIDILIMITSVIFILLLGLSLIRGTFETNYYPVIVMQPQGREAILSESVYIIYSLFLTVKHLIKVNYGFFENKQSKI
ncbi:MAG: energy-coupling factor transporter transmembrane protein EcfT [Lachnospiraceae bacterium]|nr:energy-coupling factor transporter transmembrane protein EcfT [Lachnospiraceae bacterium]